MIRTCRGGWLRGLRTTCVLLLFASYFLLVALESPFDFSDPDLEPGRSSPASLHMVLQNEPYDHLRTATASALLGLLAVGALVSAAPPRRRRNGMALLAASLLLGVSTLLGHSAWAVQPILALLALNGASVAFVHLRARPAGPP